MTKVRTRGFHANPDISNISDRQLWIALMWQDELEIHVLQKFEEDPFV